VLYRIWCVGVALLAFACVSPSQQVLPGEPIQPGTPASSENKSPAQPESKRIFGIVPNYRTSPSLKDSEPLTRGEKLKIATSFADFAIGDYMTEAIYPSLLHQDPRYFRRGTGTGWSRLS